MNHSHYHIFFTNLANPFKIKIVCALRYRESSVGELSKNLNVDQSKVSHALALLKGCKIVDSRREGKQRIYFLNKETIIPLLNLIDKHAKDNCACKLCTKNCGGQK